MSQRCYVTAQAGRPPRAQSDDEPWGTSSSQSHFKAYEPAEARSVRSGPAFVKTCLEAPVFNRPSGLRPALKGSNRIREDVRDTSAASQASAVTASQASQKSAGIGAGGQQAVSAWRDVHKRPIPERPFGVTSSYTEHQAEAQQARHDYFPYRDEFHPRSKRLLYELALQKVTGGGAKSVVSDDSVSCFTATETHVSKQTSASGASGASGMSKISSVPSFFTADSRRVGGVGAVAKRRWEAFYRAPAQSDTDRKWIMERWERDGPCGLISGNYVPSMYGDTLDKYGQRVAGAADLLPGTNDHPVRQRTYKR